MGPSPILSDYEPMLVEWVIERKKRGSSVTKNGLLDSVQKIVRNAKLKTNPYTVG